MPIHTTLNSLDGLHFSTPWSNTPPKFWEKVDKSGDCWIWTGLLDNRGRGQLGYGGRIWRAHRLAYVLTYESIPANMFVLHRCDNPPCCRPDHLFLGTHDDNVADMVSKGRQAKGQTHGFAVHPDSRPRGERHGRASITAEQVLEIRRLGDSGLGSGKIAQALGLTLSLVKHVRRGRVWSHIP